MGVCIILLDAFGADPLPFSFSLLPTTPVGSSLLFSGSSLCHSCGRELVKTPLRSYSIFTLRKRRKKRMGKRRRRRIWNKGRESTTL